METRRVSPGDEVLVPSDDLGDIRATFGQPFSLADSCIVRGGSFGLDPVAYRAALQAVKAPVVR